MQLFSRFDVRFLFIYTIGLSSGIALTLLFFTSHKVTRPSNILKELEGIRYPFFLPRRGLRIPLQPDDKNINQEGSVLDLSDVLYNKTRVLCWVLTKKENVEAKAQHVKATWGKRCNKLVFMGSVPEPTLPVIGLNTTEGRINLWYKTRAAILYIHKHYMDEADWFLKADDDTYVVVENVRKLLQSYKPQEPLYFGRRFKPAVPQGYMSGGAGYILSSAAIKKLVTESFMFKDRCSTDLEPAEDMELGFCLDNIKAKAVDTRDSGEREKFHPFLPEDHLVKGYMPNGTWYHEYSFYRAKEGPECCSDYSISFHYVEPHMMYVYDFMIYHLKPYGLGVPYTTETFS